MRIGTWNVEYGFGAEKNRRRRALLEEADADVWVHAAELVCLTRATEEAARLVAHPFIDHVCVSRSLEGGARIASAWEGTVEGARLSDHSAVVVDVPALGAARA